MAAEISSFLLTRLSEFVEARLGLKFPRERWPDLQRGMQAAAPELGFPDAEAGVRALLSGPVFDRQIEILASHLTIGETYFFREGASFAALEEHILPALIAARRDGDRRMRLWSAGCCTGEEPYSLAILLHRLLPDQESWRITLLATDINPRFLERAAEAVYGDWSFRNAPPWLREQYFHRTPEGRWALSSRIKQMVTFAPLNLADSAYPSARSGAHAMDVILCRNVLIYMAPPQAQVVVGRLHRTLAEGGVLSVSPAETSAPLFAAFRTVTFPGVTFYQKAPPPPPASPPSARPAAKSTRPLRPAVEAGVPMSPPEDEDPAARARSCADAGQLAEALAWSDKAIAADTTQSAAHYLRATILQEQGALEEAAASLRRALFLDPDFVLAHFTLGSLARQQGQAAAARRHLADALALLRGYDPAAPVPEGEGLAAGRLSQIIEAMGVGEEP